MNATTESIVARSNIWIDYSGAQTPTASLKGLRVYLADGDAPPVEALPPSPCKYWTRKGTWRSPVLASPLRIGEAR